jgi:RecB family exonuclease
MVQPRGGESVTTVRLAPLTHITPTMVARLKVCQLQVACDHDRTIQGMIVKGTAARLGTICHRVLEAIGKGAIAPDVPWNPAFDALWRQEVTRLETEIAQTPRQQHLGRAAYWPNYALRRAWLKHTAYLLWMRRRQQSPSTHGSGVAVSFERPYDAFNGRMKGIADVVRRDNGELVIEDYKTGAITVTDEQTQETIVRDSYRQQVLLYAAMHYDTTGEWPARGRLIPIEGEPLSIAVDPQEASLLAEEALALLDAYNAMVGAGASPADLARPGQKTCQWCSYHGICDSVWNVMSPEWELSQHAIEGLVLAVHSKMRGVIDADFQVQRGSVPAGIYRLRSDIPSCGAALLDAQQCQVRVTNLRHVRQQLITTQTSGVWLAPGTDGVFVTPGGTGP